MRATDAAGNTGAPNSFTWTIDTVAPTAQIVSHPASASRATDAAFGFSSEANARFECRLDNTNFAACSSPAAYNALGEGNHTFQVRATDAAGNIGAAASFSWIVDTQPPTTSSSCNGAPCGALYNRTVTVTLSAVDLGSGVAQTIYTLDGSDPSLIHGTFYLGSIALTGTTTVKYRSYDLAGNEEAIATRTITIDTTPPDTTIDIRPAALTNHADASFSFSSEANAGFECALDAGTFQHCTSPQGYSGLADGSHTFQVRATDAAGNTDATPASFTWTIDTTVPTVQIDAHPSALTDRSDAGFSFSSEPNATFDCKLDGGAFLPCTSPQSYGGLTNGSHTFQVRATDAAGNTSTPASFTWTVDTTAPTVSIDSKPAALTNHTDATFTFSGEPNARFECALDGGAFQPCTSPQSYSSLADGSHTFQVRATNQVGTTGAPASFTWTVDTTAPTVSIDSKPAALTNHTDATFTFSGEPNARFECALDGGAFKSCLSPTGYSALADGDHTFQVRATDAAGNTGTPASFNWTVDTTAPTVSIDSQPAALTNATDATFTFSSEPNANLGCKLDGGAFQPCTSPQSYSNLADGSHTFQVRATDAAGNTGTPASFTWTIDTVAPTVSIDTHPAANSNSDLSTFTFSSNEPGSTFECKVGGGSFAPCTSPKAFAGLGEGAHTFQVRAIDAAGNTGTPASFTWTIDTIAPGTTLTDEPPDPWGSSDASFSFTSNDATATFQCRLDSAAFTACANPLVVSGIADGVHTFAVRAIDAALNVDATPATYSWTVDTTPPDTSISSSPGGFSTSSATFAFTASETGSTFYCQLDGLGFVPCPSPTTFTGLSQGSHTLDVIAIDVAGNADPTPASFTWMVDTQAPTGAITAPSGGATVSGTVAVTASANDNLGVAGVQFTLDGTNLGSPVSSPPYTMQWDTTGATDGSHTLGATVRDQAGNSVNLATIDLTVSNGPAPGPLTLVPVGPGFLDPNERQVVRTSAGRVYIIASDDNRLRLGTGSGVVRAYRAGTTGAPGSFAEVDAAHHPVATGTVLPGFDGVDVRLDSAGIAHAVMVDAGVFNSPLLYTTFSTLTNQWSGHYETIASNVSLNTGHRDRTRFGLTLDANGAPHVIYASGNSVFYTNRIGGSWSAPVTLDAGTQPVHPSLTFDSSGNIDAVWLDDGATPAIKFKRRAANGTWGPTEVIAGTGVLPTSMPIRGRASSSLRRTFPTSRT